MRAHSDNGDAVYAVSGNTDLSTGRRGVFGYAYNPDWAGVEGGNTNGIGVRGYGETGVRGEGDTGVWGSSNRGGWSGVYGQHTGTSGYGVVGDGRGGSAGVLGRNSSGYGGQFEGSKAQLKLAPASSAGRPTSGAHTNGELYMDSAGTLFVCTVSGTPGTWRRFQTAAT